nr:unnamed protein product [Callosobruchus chinensis]
MMFFFGGCETSAGLINFLFYELAANQEIQIRLRKDIQATLKQCDGNLTYEALVKMEYMDMVVSGKDLILVSAICIVSLCFFSHS